MTGRLRDQWHTMTRTGTVARLFAHEEEPLLTMHADDLAGCGLRDGDLAAIASRRGAAVLRARASKELKRGQVVRAHALGPGFPVQFRRERADAVRRSIPARSSRS